MKKFNIKKFVKVSAVALAMIGAGGVASTVNANTDVHANGINYAKLISETNQSNAQIAQEDKSWQANQNKINASANDKTALNDIQINRQLDPEDIKDPYTVSYLHSKGYTDQQLRDAVKSTEKAMESNDSSSKDNYGSDHIIKRDHAIVNKAKKLHIDPSEALSNPSIINKVSNKVKKYNKQAHHKVVKPKRTHLSKTMARKIMKQIRLDKRAISNDKKQLSSRSAKRFMRNYTKKSKSMKRIKGAKHYVRYYKDETKREHELTRLTKQINKKSTHKNHNRKHVKRPNKFARHYRRSHKHNRK